MNIETILGIVGALLGVLGALSGNIFYRLGLRYKEAKWYMINTNLIQDNVSQLSISS